MTEEERQIAIKAYQDGLMRPPAEPDNRIVRYVHRVSAGLTGLCPSKTCKNKIQPIYIAETADGSRVTRCDVCGYTLQRNRGNYTD